MNEVLGFDFRYYLTVNSVRTEIVFTPDKWETNSKIGYKRDALYFGIIRTFGLPLEFVKDGATILRRAYYAYGVQAGVRIEVEQLNRTTLKYEPSFVGDIDFSKADDGEDRFAVTLMQSGASEKIKAYDNIKYEYPLFGEDVVNMILPGVVFDERADCLFIPTPTGAFRFIPETSISSGSFQSGFIESQNTIFQAVGDTSFSEGNPAHDNWFIRATKDQAVTIQGEVKGNYALTTGGPGFSVSIRDQTNAVVTTLYPAPSASGSGSYAFPIDVTIPMTAGQRLYFYFRTDGTGGNRLTISEVTSFASFYNSVSDPSNCKGLKAASLFKRIINKISPGSLSDSSLLSTAWENLIFTSGNGIREITEAKIQISLKQFFQTFQSIDDGGLGIENEVVRLELKSYFFRNAQIVNVGEVSKCNIKCAEQFMASGAKVGYNDGNTDKENGLLEYNSGQEWQWPITRLQDQKDWISEARADQYGIEKIRVDYNVKKTEAPKKSNDMSSDNDTFMIDCYLDGEVYRPILGASYQSVTGLPENVADAAYNLRLTPKKNLLRHGAYLRGVLDKMDSSYINFASAKKNAELKTVLDSIGVKENENILVASLADKYFIPHIAKISCKLPFGARIMFDTMPFGYIAFKWKGVTLKGFILEAAVDIARNAEQEFELLLTPDNNLLNLT